MCYYAVNVLLLEVIVWLRLDRQVYRLFTISVLKQMVSLRMKEITKKILAAGVALLINASAYSAEFEFIFQSLDPSGETNFQAQQAWADKLARSSNGRLNVTVVPVGTVTAHADTLDAINFSLLHGHITATSYFAAKDPAFGLIGDTVSAWTEPEQLLDYMYNGGGNQLMREMYQSYGIYYIGAATTGLEAIASRTPVKGVADLRGLKLRVPEGMVQKVFAAAGASMVNISASDVYAGLLEGSIDAADYKVFSTNHKVGLHTIAPYPVYPAFHSLPVIEFSINAASWQSLPADLQDLMQESVKEFAYNRVIALQKADAEAVAEAIINPLITLIDWPEQERKKFRIIARRQWEVYAKRSKKEKKAYDSLISYLKERNLL